MKTLLCYDTGKQLYYEELGSRLPSVGHTVDLPDGRYKVVDSITSPAQFRADNRNVRRTGAHKLVDILTRSYPGKIAQVAKYVRRADNLQKGGLIVPGLPKEDFDDVICLKLELVGEAPQNLSEQAGAVHALLSNEPRRRFPNVSTTGGSGTGGRKRKPLGKLVLTDDAKQ